MNPWLASTGTLAAGLVGLAFGGCAAAPGRTSDHEACLAAPDQWGEGQIRRGTLSGFRLEERDVGDASGVFVATVTRRGCLDSVTIRGPGVAFAGGPYLLVDNSAFGANYVANRAAFYFFTKPHEAWMWIDGHTEGPYASIAVGPRFSPNGRHLAYAVGDARGRQAVVVDGRTVLAGGLYSDMDMFQVLDDGRIVASSRLPRGGFEVVVGDYTSAPLEDFCSDKSLQVEPSGRWSFTARKPSGWVVVVDGKEIAMPGTPTSCAIAFSQDGAHQGLLVFAGTREHREAIAMIDGRNSKVDDTAGDFFFVGNEPMVRLEKQVSRRSGGLAWQFTFDLFARPSPAVPPTVDDYQPDGSGDASQWMRVQIGESVGPLFDRVVKGTLAVGADGRVRYRGERGGAAFEVIDNVIQVTQTLVVPR